MKVWISSKEKKPMGLDQSPNARHSLQSRIPKNCHHWTLTRSEFPAVASSSKTAVNRRPNPRRPPTAYCCREISRLAPPNSPPDPASLVVAIPDSQTRPGARTLEEIQKKVTMGLVDSSGDLSGEMEVDAFRRLFPLRYYERHLAESIRPDGRTLGMARDTTLALGAVSSADGSALTKIGSTTMLAAIKMEVMTPSAESPDEGCIAIEFHMPPICSPIVRPGRPAEAAVVESKRLSDTILRTIWLVFCSSGMINLKELALVSGKAAWMAYLDIYCLDADGALFDAALLSAVAAFSHLQIPVVSLNDKGKIVAFTEEGDTVGKLEKEAVNKEKRKLTLGNIPFSLTCALHKKHILADPSSEEESIMETLVTVVMDSSDRLVSFYKPGGALAYTSLVTDCVRLTRQRMKELEKILDEAFSGMEVD
ncbi:unnamed protein product [Linum tenue]|uniref:Ribosomal RNA-processing protein 43 n=1 Tax=Linum tenue TaxID=586396 RepID=A0AAV0LMM1_9ROSI|nr:unnamed protein product [Linum tenue]